MKVVSNVTQEPMVKLSSVTPGKVIRFPATTYEECLQGIDQACFYMVVKTQKETAGRVTMVSLDGSSLIERDGINLVHVHESEVAVKSL